MKRIFAALAILCPFAAQAAPTPLGPHNGAFGDWIAASDGTGATKTCYAFTKAQLSKPNWKSRGLVMLTVTERHGVRDAISITPGYTYPKSASVKLSLGKASIPFYIDGGVAFTDSTKAALAGFAKQDEAVATSIGPKGKPVQDHFSLSGFSAAYKAINAACPK